MQMPPSTVHEGYLADITIPCFYSITKATFEHPPMSVTASLTTETERKPRLLVLFGRHHCSTNWSTNADVVLVTHRRAQLNLELFGSETIVFQGSTMSSHDTVSVRCTDETAWQEENIILFWFPNSPKVDVLQSDAPGDSATQTAIALAPPVLLHQALRIHDVFIRIRTSKNINPTGCLWCCSPWK